MPSLCHAKVSQSCLSDLEVTCYVANRSAVWPPRFMFNPNPPHRGLHLTKIMKRVPLIVAAAMAYQLPVLAEQVIFSEINYHPSAGKPEFIEVFKILNLVKLF